MNKRRAARELALIAFSQIGKSLKKGEKVNIPKIIYKSAKTLTREAENTLESAVNELVKVREYISNFEMDHPENIKRPYETSTIPVPIPLTSDMIGRIDMLLEELISLPPAYSPILGTHQPLPANQLQALPR